MEKKLCLNLWISELPQRNLSRLRFWPIAVQPIEKSNKLIILTKSAFTCSKLTVETLEQGVKYVQN